MATNAARFTKTYSAEQKQALLRAVLIDGRKVSEARKMAAAGELGVPAFELSTAAYSIVKDGQELFEATNETALERAIDEAIRLDAILALKHDRTLRQTFKPGTSDPEALKRSARALAEIKKARRDAQRESTRGQAKTTKPAATSQTDAYTPRETTTVTDLLELVPARPLNPAASDAESGSLTDAPNT